MFARLMAMGIPAASFFVAGVLTAQAQSAPDKAAVGQSKTGKKMVVSTEARAGPGAREVVLVKTATAGSGAKRVAIISSGDGTDAKIIIESDGKRRVIELDGLGEEIADAVEEALEAIGDIEIDVTVDLDEEQVAKLSKDRRVMRFEGEDGKVVILRSDDKDARVEVKRSKDGKTIVIIEDGDVDVITPHRQHKRNGKKPHKDKAGQPGNGDR